MKMKIPSYRTREEVSGAAATFTRRGRPQFPQEGTLAELPASDNVLPFLTGSIIFSIVFSGAVQ